MSKERAVVLGEDKKKVAKRAAEDPAYFAKVLGALNGEDRAQRVRAARAIHELALHTPEILRPCGTELAEALEKPEAQTRWEILGALEQMVAVDARVCDKAIAAATAALHDEGSGVVRLAAFRMLATYGATTSHRSDRVWPLLDEAIRVYHGDSEFGNMLSGVHRLVLGAASDEVKVAAADRLEFDSEHTKGIIGKRAKRIVACAPKWRKRKIPLPEEV